MALKTHKRLFFLTGNPGLGKTTVLLKAVDALKARGYSVGGMVSREVRVGDARVGFEILDLGSDRKGWLAHVNQKSGPQVGKYHVNMEDLNGVGSEAILNAVECCDVVAIDEIGPMELFSQKFREAVRRAIESRKLVLGVIHWKAKDKLIDEVKKREDVEIITVTYENRNELDRLVVEKILESLEFCRNKKDVGF